MIGAVGDELVLELCDLERDGVDEPQRRLDVAEPRFGELEAGEQRSAFKAEQVRYRAGVPEGEQADRMRFFNAVRCRTRWRRKRASSRSQRTAGSGSQMAGTRSFRLNSASTWASMRSVLRARGAIPFTFWALAISTDQPYSSKVSCTKRAPFIDSMTARTSSLLPYVRATEQTSRRRPSRSGGAVVTSSVVPFLGEQMDVETVP